MTWNIREDPACDIPQWQVDHMRGRCWPETCPVCAYLMDENERKKRNGNESTDQ